MQHDIRQPGYPRQPWSTVKITRDRDDARGTELIMPCTVSYQRVDAVLFSKEPDSAPCDVAATNDEQSFHALIMR